MRNTVSPPEMKTGKHLFCRETENLMKTSSSLSFMYSLLTYMHREICETQASQAPASVNPHLFVSLKCWDSLC
ncbi:hypothetical protein Y1Q_0003056 [Alligator mississippiensis]|uniref:Uncharacterized protein n=1 Tax=Alligator mississippiensis TaxID=8496 RepID=A0A151MD81_ALLMI|nr:hypothetical protein Y1Q_0003056 [Alligator mississippiensis]